MGHTCLFMRGYQDYGQNQEHEHSHFKKLNVLRNQRFSSTDLLESFKLVTLRIQLLAL